MSKVVPLAAWKKVPPSTTESMVKTTAIQVAWSAVRAIEAMTRPMALAAAANTRATTRTSRKDRGVKSPKTAQVRASRTRV